MGEVATHCRNLPPESCPRPAGDCLPILEEYAEAVQLLHRMRGTVSHPGRGRVRHRSLPLGQISADFFCDVEHPVLGWYGLLADVAGHGLVSSLFALHVPTLFRESVLLGMSLPAIYARIGNFLAQRQIGGYFVCGTLVRVREREVEVINAGMPDALLLAADGRRCEAFRSRELPFGVVADTDIPAVDPQRYRLARDETASLLMYSDGLSELGVLDDDVFGPANRLPGAGPRGAGEVFDRLIDRIGQRVEDAHDDISIALISLPMRHETPAAIGMAETGALSRGGGVDPAMHLPAVRRIVENIEYGMVLTDTEQRILYVNPAFTAITGYSFDESLGQTPRLLSSGRHTPHFYRDMWQALRERGNWAGDIWNRRKDGTLYLEWLDIQTVRDETGGVTNYLAIFSDIMRTREKEDRLRFMALHDPLTGLANRILLSDHGQQAIWRCDRSEHALAVLFIDLDRFKSINDSLGHDIGDEVLASVGRRLEAALREGDTLARIGGDQFVCLLPDIAARQDALRVANKLLAELSLPVEVAGHQFNIGASIGVSAYPSDGRSFDDLIVRADRAMLWAKRAGGNLVRFFTAAMMAEINRQLEMEARLSAAIEGGELEVFYQPKVDLASRCIIGAEALVRWRDPQYGLVAPGVFIPVAERGHLIVKIGQWVLREACAMLARRHAALPAEFHVAVNVSPMQLDRCDLAGEVIHAVTESGIPPHRLQLEITESLIIRDAKGAAEVLRRIVDFGVSVALDDFGTGYSNLATLNRLPIDTFKLDQSFVRGIDGNAMNGSIARSVWHLANGLGKQVVAEGVETCAECIVITGMGYRFAQGYRFGKPMPEDELLAYCANGGLAACTCPPPACPA